MTMPAGFSTSPTKAISALIEKQGETWGFRGSYRKMLRLILDN
jgi:hypothetical protein